MKSRKKLWSLTSLLVILVLSGACSFEAPPRDNPNDPKASNYNGAGGQLDSLVVRDGLVSWWKFNGDMSDSGPVANGMSGCTDSYVPDRFGNASAALQLSGGLCGAVSQPGYNTPPFTVEFWVNLTTASMGLSILRKSIGTPDCSTNNGYQVSLDTADYISVNACYNAAYTTLSPSFALATNKWYHFFLVIRDSSFDLFDLTDGTVTPYVKSATVPYNSDSGSFSLLNQYMHYDDVRYYSRELTQDEMKQNHNATER